MLRKIGWVGFAGAVGVAVFLACTDDPLPGTGLCTTDGDCLEGEICHPDAKVCVQTCTAGADCPDSAKNCAAISATNSTQICKCTTTPLCAADNSDLICSDTFDVCVTKCTSNVDCASGYTCDTASGDCKAGGGTDGGADAGTCGWDTCSTADWSSSTQGQTCTASGCAAGASCSGSAQSSCVQNEYCAGGACGLPPRPKPGNTGSSVNCTNFFSGTYQAGPVWNPSSDNGPVIYEISKLGSGTGTGTGNASDEFGQCPTTHTQFNVRVRAYRTDADWPSTRTAWATSGPALFYVNTDGDRRDMQAAPTLLRPNVGYNPTGRTVDIQGYFCLTGTSVANFQPGFVFGAGPGQTGVRGNEACRQL